MRLGERRRESARGRRLAEGARISVGKFVAGFETHIRLLLFSLCRGLYDNAAPCGFYSSGRKRAEITMEIMSGLHGCPFQALR